jgi:hypothetical protein
MMRVNVLVLGVLLFAPAPSFAEWQLRPFLGATFGGGTTFVDLAGAAGGPHAVVGVNAALLGNVIGVDADFAHAPGFFQSGDQHLVLRSSVTTLIGNVVIAPSRRLTEYTLGPYFILGAGLVHAHIDDVSNVFSVSRTLPAMDIGGGANGFFSDRIGLSWDARYFWSVGRNETRGLSGLSFGAEQLSFWRASMALVIRH